MKSTDMETTKRSIVIFLAMMVMFLFSNIPSVFAGDYLGEFCWLSHITESDGGPVDETYIARYGVTHIGAPYYMLHGMVEVPGDNPLISQGTAKVIGNEVYITLNSAQEHTPSPYRDIGTGQAILNVSTLNGTFWSISKSFNTSTREFSDFYSAGTMTLTPCP